MVADGVLLSGSQWRVETGEIRERDLQTGDSSGISRAFTTQVERRTIGISTTVAGDFDGARWGLVVHQAETQHRGGLHPAVSRGSGGRSSAACGAGVF